MDCMTESSYTVTAHHEQIHPDIHGTTVLAHLTLAVTHLCSVLFVSHGNPFDIRRRRVVFVQQNSLKMEFLTVSRCVLRRLFPRDHCVSLNVEPIFPEQRTLYSVDQKLWLELSFFYAGTVRSEIYAAYHVSGPSYVTGVWHSTDHCAAGLIYITLHGDNPKTMLSNSLNSKIVVSSKPHCLPRKRHHMKKSTAAFVLGVCVGGVISRRRMDVLLVSWSPLMLSFTR